MIFIDNGNEKYFNAGTGTHSETAADSYRTADIAGEAAGDAVGTVGGKGQGGTYRQSCP